MSIGQGVITTGLGLALYAGSTDTVAIFTPLQQQMADGVPVFNENGQPKLVSNQAFPNAQPMRATVSPSSRIMDHPTEEGNITSDYKVTLPIEIRIPLHIKAEFYKDTYAEIANLYDNSTSLTVQTRVKTYGDMVIVALPHDETPEKFDAITLLLHLRQVQVTVAQTASAASNFSPADATMNDTQAIGEQQPGTISGVATSSGISQNVPLNPDGDITNPPIVNELQNQDAPIVTGVAGVTPGPPITGTQALTIQNGFYP